MWLLYDGGTAVGALFVAVARRVLITERLDLYITPYNADLF